MEIYENYIMLDDTLTNEVKHFILGEQFELSSKRIQQILYNMQKDII